jgi:hypothetical protein
MRQLLGGTDCPCIIVRWRLTVFRKPASPPVLSKALSGKDKLFHVVGEPLLKGI